MNLESIDGSLFLYDPRKDSELKRLEESHEDFRFPLYSGTKTIKKQILRFIILQYDKNTSLRAHFPNYYKRKMNAALMAGFIRNKKTGRFSNSVTGLLKGEDEGVNRAIVRYAMQFFDNDYLMLIVMRELLGGQAADWMKAKNSKSLTQSNVSAIKDMRNEIDKLVEKVFGGSESKQLEEELYKALEVEKEALHPDYVANMGDEDRRVMFGTMEEDE